MKAKQNYTNIPQSTCITDIMVSRVCAVLKKHIRWPHDFLRYTPNNEIHRYSTRNNSNLHLPTINLSKFYKGPYISGTKAFNHLPRYLKLLVSDVKRFKISLKRFLYHHSFYSVKEYYEHNEDKDM